MLTQNRKNTVRKSVRTYCTNARLKVRVSWITLLLLMIHGVTTINQTQNGCSWGYVNSPRKKKFKTWPSVDKMMGSVFLDRNVVILLDFLELGQTISSDR